MARHDMRVYIPNRKKEAAKKRLEPAAQAFDDFDPGCLFVIDANGTRCGKPVFPNKNHTIAESKVLAPMSHRGKVLEAMWGIRRMADFFLRGDEANTLNFYDPSRFRPPEVGTGDASTGYYACKGQHENHDSEFNPIDCANLDFSVSAVSTLAHYRAYLWAEYQLRRVKYVLERECPKIMRGGSKVHRSNYFLQRDNLGKTLPEVQEITQLLGTAWHTQGQANSLSPNLVGSREIHFCSNLKFAACIFLGLKAVATVLPVEDDLHKVGITYLARDEQYVVDCINSLEETAATSLGGPNFEARMLQTLFGYGAGIVEISPVSYQTMDDGERLKVNEMVRNISQADNMADGIARLTAEQKSR